MAGLRSLASDYGDDGERCQKTDGKRWRCPMPAQPNKSFCSHHRLTIINTPPSSLHQNPSRVSNHRKTGPGESEEDSEHDNLGSDKKRRIRKEMAVSDLVAEKSLNPVDASTKKRGSKKKKIARSGARRISDSLNLDKGEVDLALEEGGLVSDPVETAKTKRVRTKKKLVDSDDLLNLDKGEVDLALEEGDLVSDPVDTAKKKRVRTKKKLVDSDYLFDLETERESRAESGVEKLENSSDKAADVVMDSCVEDVAKVLDLENAVNQKDKSSDGKIGVEMDQQTGIDNLNMLDSEINKEKTTIGGDMDNFEVSSGKESIIEMDSGLDKVSENLDLHETNERKRGMKLKATASDMKKIHLDSNMMAEFGGDLVARVSEMNYAERVDVEMNSSNNSDHIVDHLNKNDKSRKKETVSSYQMLEGILFVSDVQNHETNSDKTAEKTEVEMDLSGGKDDQNLSMLEKNKNKTERKKVEVLDAQVLEKSSNVVAGVEENIQQTSGHESYNANKKNIIDDDDPEVPKLSQSSDKTTAVEIVVEKDMALEKAGEILDMVITDKCSNQPVENSNSDKRNQIPRRKRGKEILHGSEVDSDGELLNQTLSSFKTNRKRNKKENKTDITEESEAEFDPIAHDLMMIAMKRQMEKVVKIRKEKESEVRKELPNGVMAISPGPITFSSKTVHAFDKKIGLVVDDNFVMQRRFRSKNVEPEPVAVVKKLPIRVSRGEKKGKCVQNSGKMDIQKGTASGISEGLTVDQNRSSSIQHTDYMISQLRPVLKQMDWEQVLEIEVEAKNQGKNLAGVRVQTIECAQDMQYKCNFCRGSIVNLLRGCSNCCYKLCLSCCQGIRGKNLPKEAEIMTSGYAIEQKHNDHSAGTRDRIKKGSFSIKTRDEQIPCPPSGLGGCGQEVLIMKLLLPFGLLENVEGSSNN